MRRAAGADRAGPRPGPWLAGAALALAVAAADPAAAYLKLGVRAGDRLVTLRWTQLPVRYFVNDAGAPGVTAQQFREAIDRAFATWQAVPTSSFAATFAGFTSARPLDEDNMNVLGFRARPELERVLAATTFTVDTRTGEIVESDVFFNTTFQWSTAAAGETGRFDLESVAVHEIGHLLGLGHSAIGETELQPNGRRRVIAASTVMFPIAFSAGSVEDRRLKPDDIAGASDVYPEGRFRSDFGSIAGTVTKNGVGVFGAHVVAFDLRRGRLIGNFSLDDRGSFAIAGLEPGLYLLRAEPLDDADVDGFFEPASRVDIDFRPVFLDRLVVVPRGGGSARVEIRVTPK